MGEVSRRKQMFIKSVYVEPGTYNNQYLLKRYGYLKNEFTNPAFIHFLSEYYKKNEGKVFYFNGGTTSVFDLFEFLIQHIRNNPDIFEHNLPSELYLKPGKKKSKPIKRIEVDRDEITSFN